VPGNISAVTDLFVRDDGDVMAAGVIYQPAWRRLDSLDNELRDKVGSTVGLARFNGDGSADASFGKGGVATAQGAFAQRAVVRELDDGTFAVAAGTADHAFAAVFTAAGALVRSGTSEAIGEPASTFPVVAIQPDGKILLARLAGMPGATGAVTGTSGDATIVATSLGHSSLCVWRFVWSEGPDAPALPGPPSLPDPPVPGDPLPGEPLPQPAQGGGEAAPLVSGRFIGSPSVGRKRFYSFKVAYAAAGLPGASGLDPSALGDVFVADPSGTIRLPRS
jgi:hypothetical protein